MTQYDNIVVTPVYGPLSTNQYPGSMRPHNLGALPGKHPNPPQYYPSNNSSEFANARHEYARIAVAATAMNRLGQSTKYIAPASSSMLTSARKRTAVGKSSYKQGMPDAALLSYKNYNKNDVKTAIQRARSRGYVAPKKIGAIENNSLRNGQICAWGSYARQFGAGWGLPNDHC